MNRFSTILAFVTLCVAVLSGCQRVAPMHVWAPPRIESAVGKRLVLAAIVGPAQEALALRQALDAELPREPARNFTLIDQHSLQRLSEIQLASASEAVPSDVALLHAARQQGIDYLMLGEILERTQGPPSPWQRDLLADDPRQTGENPTTGKSAREVAAETHRTLTRPLMVVSWRILDVRNSAVAGAMPVAVTNEELTTLYPDLLPLRATDPQRACALAAARESWQLVTPFITRLNATLAEPYLTPGSKRVRQGNEAAAAGRWAEAEKVWQEVLAAHPSNHAAEHNLALAAAARQDLVLAKKMAQRALSRHSSATYERTVVWIEQRQHDQQRAFDLPPPEEGWLFSVD